MSKAQEKPSIMIDRFESYNSELLKEILLKEYTPVDYKIKGKWKVTNTESEDVCACSYFQTFSPSGDNLELYFCDKGPRPINLFYKGKSLAIDENEEYRNLLPFIHTTRIQESPVYWHDGDYSNYVIIYLEPMPTITSTPRMVLLVNLNTNTVYPIYTNQYNDYSTFPRLLSKYNNVFYPVYLEQVTEDEKGKKYSTIIKIFLWN